MKTCEMADKLIHCFHDSYENNKNLALEILKTFPTKTALKLEDDKNLEDLQQEWLDLVRSHKPPDSIR